MTYQIIAFDEPLPHKSLMVVIFGQPGTGKTSLSFTTEKPVLLDFDDGLERAVNRKTAVKFDSWQDANSFLDSDDFKNMGAKTLNLDTGGTMLDDFIAHYVVSVDPKNSRGGGDLSLQGYGSMKNVFDQFRSKTKALGVDVIMVCHTKSIDDGGTQKHVPKLTGGAYDILMAKADLVGYTSMKGNKITIDFNPTDNHTGKNCAQIPIQEVPNYTEPEYATFLGDLLQKTKDFMTRQSESQVKAVEEVAKFRGRIAKVKKLDDLEDIKEEMYKLSPMYQAQVKQAHDDRFIELWPKKWLKNVKEPDDFEAITEQVNSYAKYVIAELRPIIKKHMEKVGVEYDTTAKEFIKSEKAKPKNDAKGKGASKSEETTEGDNSEEGSDASKNEKPKEEGDTVTSKKGEKLKGTSTMSLEDQPEQTEMGL